VTERQRLKLLVEAEGTRLSEEEARRLFSAWKRYRALVEQLRRQIVQFEGES
jgi:hypothetical protein